MEIVVLAASVVNLAIKVAIAPPLTKDQTQLIQQTKVASVDMAQANKEAVTKYD